MNKTLKYLIIFCFLALFISYLIGVGSLNKTRREGIYCTGVDIKIKDSLNNEFVTRADVLGFIKKEFGDCKGIHIDSLNSSFIETMLDQKSAIKKSQVYMTQDGVLNISIKQREPILRFQNGNRGYYVDKDNFLFPLQKSYASHVLIIDGAIPIIDLNNNDKRVKISETKQSKWLKQILELTQYIEENDIWRHNIVQISIQKNGDIIIIPRQGREKFIFGRPMDIENKFELMELYYTSIAPSKEKDYYSSVSVKFKDQIICKK